MRNKALWSGLLVMAWASGTVCTSVDAAGEMMHREILPEESEHKEQIPEQPTMEEAPDQAIMEKPMTEEAPDQVIEEEPITEETPDQVLVEEPMTEEAPDQVIAEEPMTEEAPDQVIAEEPMAEEVTDQEDQEELMTEETQDQVIAEEPVSEEETAAEQSREEVAEELQLEEQLTEEPWEIFPEEVQMEEQPIEESWEIFPKEVQMEEQLIEEPWEIFPKELQLEEQPIEEPWEIFSKELQLEKQPLEEPLKMFPKEPQPKKQPTEEPRKVLPKELQPEKQPKKRKEADLPDRKAPVIRMVNLSSTTASTEDVTPEIIVKDTSLKKNGVRVTLLKENGEVAELPLAAEKRVADGELTYQMGKITEDGRYTLMIESEDETGNVSKKQCTFTINKKGSQFACSYEEVHREGQETERTDPKIRIQNYDDLKILSCMINGKETAYTWEGEFLILKEETLTAGKNIITLETKDGAGNISCMKPWEIYKEQVQEKEEVSIKKDRVPLMIRAANMVRNLYK